MKSLRHGFSLIEVILSISVGMALMAGATFYLFGVTQAYTLLREEPVFDDHIEGVLSLLESFLGTTSQSPKTRSTEPTEGNPESPGQKPPPSTAKNNRARRKGSADLRWEEPPGGSVLKDFALAFDPKISSPFFAALPGASPTFTGYLTCIRGEGLYFIYQTTSQKKESPNDVFVYWLSPYVTAMEYAFYDLEKDTWDFYPGVPPGVTDEKPKLPTAIRLTFESEGREVIRYVFLSNI